MAQQQGSGFGSILKWGIVGVAVWFIYENFFAAPATSAPAPTTGAPATTQTAAAPVTAAPAGGLSAAGQSSLNSIYQAMLSKSSGDPAVVNGAAPVSVWNYWLQAVIGSPMPSGGYAPGAPADPTPITAAAFWAIAAPNVIRLQGLSGLVRGLRGYQAAPAWRGTAIRPGYIQ